MTDEVGETATRWCIGCDAPLAPPIRDRYAIQVCGVCGTEQPHWHG